MKSRLGDRLSQIILNTFFLLLALLMFYPFWYVLMYSFSDPSFASAIGLNLYPKEFTLSTYAHVFSQKYLYVGFKNSLIVTVGGTLIGLLLTIGCAYPLAKNNLHGRNVLFIIIFITMLVHGGLIPTYLLVKSLHMVDTLWALSVPSAVSVFCMLIMIKFYRGIPTELVESAKMDGANDWTVLLRIIIPLSGAVNATIGLIYAVGHWNAYMPGIIYIHDQGKRVLQVVLKGMLQEESLNQPDMVSSPESIKMAAVIISMIPILLVYPYLQKYFVKGMLIGGVKG